MRRDHVEMPLADRNVDRLADCAAGMVQPGDSIGKLHEILEVGERAVAPAAVDVLHERRAVGRRKRHIVPAEVKRSLRIARVLHESARGGCENRPQESGRKANAFAIDVRAGVAPQPQRLVVAAEVHADILQDGVRRRLDADEVFLAEKLDGRDLAPDAGNDRLRSLSRALAPGSSPALALSRRGLARHRSPPNGWRA